MSDRQRLRMRKRRARWGHIERQHWTERDLATLLLHVEFFGFEWALIAHSMQRSPDAIRNKLVRLHRDFVWERRREARAWLQDLVEALGLTPPPCWGHRDDEELKSAHDVPAPIFKYRRGTAWRARSAAAALEVAGAG
jgi:hypothetical protein